MKKKLNKILLIDDSSADNFIHSRVIRKADVAEEIIAIQSGQGALDYLTKSEDGIFPNPELIFLDINMPGMNGWEFLEEYRTLDDELRKGIVVCMLTTSYAEEDKATAAKYNVISDFSNKPLTKEVLMDIITKYYPDHI